MPTLKCTDCGCACLPAAPLTLPPICPACSAPLPWKPVTEALLYLRQASTLAPPNKPSTTVYVWGCGRPGASLAGWDFRYTSAAAAFAVEHGWSEGDWAAWVIETKLPLSLSEVVGQYARRLQDDPAVTGWGARIVR